MDNKGMDMDNMETNSMNNLATNNTMDREAVEDKKSKVNL